MFVRSLGATKWCYIIAVVAFVLSFCVYDDGLANGVDLVLDWVEFMLVGLIALSLGKLVE